MKVAILVFPGVEEFDFVGFLETLVVANRVKGRRYFETELVGTDDGPIVCSGGVKVVPDRTLSQLKEHDLLFVPGGGASSSTGVDLLMKNRQILGRLEESYREGKKVWSVCTGALVLAKAGLLKGKRAVTHHAHLNKLRSFGVTVVQNRTVTDGRVTSGAGISSSIDIGLLLVEQELGEGFKRRVQMRMEYPPPSQRASKS